jgi:hypothetical protein
MAEEDDFESVWSRMSEAEGDAPGAADGPATEQPMPPTPEQLGPPIRVTLVVESESVPVAPWAQGWRVGAVGPIEGHVTMLFEHDVDIDPAAQLSAIVGLLGTVKAARLKLVWWVVQTRGPIPTDEEDDAAPADLDQEFSDYLSGGSEDAPSGGN